MRTLRGMADAARPIGAVDPNPGATIGPVIETGIPPALFYEGFHESTPDELALDAYIARTQQMFALDEPPAPGGPGYYEEPPAPIAPSEPKKGPGIGTAIVGLLIASLIFGWTRN